MRHAHEGTDIRAVIDGYVSITPLDTTLTHAEHHDALSKHTGRADRGADEVASARLV